MAGVGGDVAGDDWHDFGVGALVGHLGSTNGTPAGKTSAEVPVFNVALPVISKLRGEEMPLFVYEL